MSGSDGKTALGTSSCTTDYIVSFGASDDGLKETFDRYCGGKLGTISGQTTPSIVRSKLRINMPRGFQFMSIRNIE